MAALVRKGYSNEREYKGISANILFLSLGAGYIPRFIKLCIYMFTFWHVDYISTKKILKTGFLKCPDLNSGLHGHLNPAYNYFL